MRGFLTNLTVVMLFAHGVLGCCSHHVHACGESHGSLGLVDGKHPCSDACGDHSAGGSGQTSHKHPGQDDCQGSRCVFWRPTNDWEAESCHVFCQPAVLLLSEAMPVLAGGRLEHDFGRNGVLPPVRLHLVHQVLLI